ncbi:3-isopropylmalate dehydrogenase [Metabacillus sp. GX 13764]|uniref:3-isopropylmalate dehydrogenase n=1 Tax=Metabacillus kandeliae TaxID=2900151 RepID=UPI001E3211FE|nr:3-isopropylmalate dehydrogenase [Metabacillus kandeliae]MCD7032878.1 3-isopropylmalate dehydrogenase [Metabacillus kandeliae]
MKKTIAMLPGDGIGKEVMDGAKEILKAIGEQFHHTFTFQYGKIGGEALDHQNDPLPEETLALCKNSDAVLLGAVGGPKWESNSPEKRPEKGLLRLRKDMKLHANIRPVKAYESLADHSPFKKEYVENVDMVIVRELTGGLYFGKPSERQHAGGKESAVDTLFYSKEEVDRIIRTAFEMAKGRKMKVTSVDKANVLESSRMWRETAEEIAKEYPDIELEHMLVDNAAMQLIKNPARFDVIVTENMFGDILSDEASVLTGSLGMLPSASLSEEGLHLYEPVHGSAPDIAGKNLANPLAMILSAAMMLRQSFGMEAEAEAVENAVKRVLDGGKLTPDLAVKGKTILSTVEMVEEVKAVLAEEDAILSIMEAYA